MQILKERKKNRLFRDGFYRIIIFYVDDSGGMLEYRVYPPVIVHAGVPAVGRKAAVDAVDDAAVAAVLLSAAHVERVVEAELVVWMHPVLRELDGKHLTALL